jgi:hypothetical protein
MNLLLTHLPHIGLAILVTVLFVWMERSDRRARLVTVGGHGMEEQAGGPRGAQVVGLLIGVSLSMSVLGLVLLEMRNDPPGSSLVLTYLTAGLAAAAWAGWSTPRRLPAPVQQRLGHVGRFLVGGVILMVLLWGVVFAGLMLAQGVVLPTAGLG